jgi:carboxyl-terminal processing protease
MGAALPSVVERLPNGDGFQYAFANYVSRGGEVLEGVGVVPDVEVEPSRESLLQGTDAALDAAVAWIREYLRKAPAKSREGGRP